MPNIVEISDFTGELQIQEDQYTEDKFNPIRDKFEDEYLYELLGAELTGLFLDDLDTDGVPESEIFQKIYNKFAYDEGCDVIQSKGLKEYMKGVIWFEFARQNPFSVSLGGNSISKSENGSPIIDENFYRKPFNEAITTGRSIQAYICENKNDYPTYNGQELKYMTL